MVRQADIDEANKPENKCDQKGINWERSCTDVIFCLVFTVFIVVMVALAGLGFK